MNKLISQVSKSNASQGLALEQQNEGRQEVRVGTVVEAKAGVSGVKRPHCPAHTGAFRPTRHSWPGEAGRKGLADRKRSVSDQKAVCPTKDPGENIAWIAGQVPSRGHMRGNHTLIFLSLSPSLPLSKNKYIKSLKKTVHVLMLSPR